MPTRKTAAPPPADLRTAILDTAESLLESDGLGALSMREVARRAGVTHQAPYHHFADRETILAELVARGFDELATRLARANERAPKLGGRELRIASGEAYVGFALDRPGVFRIMFRPEVCDPARFPAAQAAGNRAHGELARLVQLLHGPDPGGLLASGYWAQVHGLATLLVDGPLGHALPGARERRAHLRAVLGLMADGALSAR
jgi:AcrR family transcriptional regulator